MEKEEIVPITILNNEEYLRQISKTVDIENDKELNADLEKLSKYCHQDGMLALAAIQIGIPKRLLYVKNTNLEMVKKVQFSGDYAGDKDYDEAQILINPVITKKEGLASYWESCASCLDNMGFVYRPYKISVEYYDVDNKKHFQVFEGFPAVVLSHEIDHLDGILHIDIAEEVKDMKAEDRMKWRQTHEYEVYSQEGDYQLLLNEKHNDKLDKILKV